MIHTVEDALEILSGNAPRNLNIRIDYNEKNLIKSLGRQVSNSLALTDRQLDLVLKKIEKYREGLEKNGIDVDHILSNKPLRMPLRDIDRSQKVFISKQASSNKDVLVIKFNYSKRFTEIWEEVQEKLIGTINEINAHKEILLTETNIFHVVGTLQNQEFDIDSDVLQLYEKIEKIWENPMNHVPYADIETDHVVVRNINKNCELWLSEKFQDADRKNVLSYVNKLKHYGIYGKSSSLVSKINTAETDDLTRNIVSHTSTRFRITPSVHTFTDLLASIGNLEQYPILIVVDEDKDVFRTVLNIYDELKNTLDSKDINVFFRLDNGQPHHREFNQFVKDNGLNNYIGPQTKVVFISKNRIPKPLIKADWHPACAIVVSNHDFGKTSAFLDDIPGVYYYNESISLRNNRIKGARSIVQL
jgi:hypothetical protein